MCNVRMDYTYLFTHRKYGKVIRWAPINYNGLLTIMVGAECENLSGEMCIAKAVRRSLQIAMVMSPK